MVLTRTLWGGSVHPLTKRISVPWRGMLLRWYAALNCRLGMVGVLYRTVGSGAFLFQTVGC